MNFSTQPVHLKIQELLQVLPWEGLILYNKLQEEKNLTSSISYKSANFLLENVPFVFMGQNYE